jgi:hypothetical protein
MAISWKVIGISIAAVVLLTLGFQANTCVGKHEVKADETKAAVQAVVAQKSENQEVTHDQAAAKRAPVLAEDNSEVARLEAAKPAPAVGLPAAPAVPGAQPLGSPAVVVADPEAPLVAALKKDLADTQAQLADMTAARDAAEARGKAQDAEIADLHAALAAQAPTRPWAAGVVYGTDSTAGVFVARDLSLVQIGVDVVRRHLSNGQTTLEAVAHAGFRF